MPIPDDDLAQLLAAVLAYRPQPPARPTCPIPAAACPRFGEWCGFLENGARIGSLFPSRIPLLYDGPS